VATSKAIMEENTVFSIMCHIRISVLEENDSGTYIRKCWS